MNTREGALKAKETNLKRHGDDFYGVIGSKGGKAKVATKGFGADTTRASEAGKKGGSMSSREIRLSGHVINRIIRMRNQGYSFVEIGESVGQSWWVVRSRYKKYVENSDN